VTSARPEVYIYFERYARDSFGWKSTVCSAIFELSLKRDFENQIAILLYHRETG
jgi:hypothetical protein